MVKEISVGGIVFIKDKGITYLVLKYGAGHWDFVKGHLEDNESEGDTFVRELKEETGIKDFNIIDGFKEEISYFFKKDGKLVSKKVIFYLIESKTKEVRLSFEHSDYKWLNFEEAYTLVTFKTAKGVLKKANEFLNK